MPPRVPGEKAAWWGRTHDRHRIDRARHALLPTHNIDVAHSLSGLTQQPVSSRYKQLNNRRRASSTKELSRTAILSSRRGCLDEKQRLLRLTCATTRPSHLVPRSGPVRQ